MAPAVPDPVPPQRPPSKSEGQLCLIAAPHPLSASLYASSVLSFPTTATRRSLCWALGLMRPLLGDSWTSSRLPHPPLSLCPSAASWVTGRLSRELLA